MATKSNLQVELINTVEGTASWRAEKAAEYPDDIRNAASSQALTQLAEQLTALPESHPKFRALEISYESADEDILISWVEAETEILNRYGFDGAEEGGERSGIRYCLCESRTLCPYGSYRPLLRRPDSGGSGRGGCG
jgi:hypothetical protein